MKEKMEDFTKSKKKDVNYKKVFKEIMEWVICFVVAYVIYLVINFFFGTISGVKQVSMFPTARENDRLLIQSQKVFKRKINRGDIVTFEAPKDVGFAEDVDKDDVVADFEKYNFMEKFMHNFVGIKKVSYIKRVIGVAGDEVEINEKGEVFVNGDKLNEPYLHDSKTPKTGEYMKVKVPLNCVYVMGDNRGESKDSRYFGCIPVSRIDGYVLVRIWPLNKIGKLK